MPDFTDSWTERAAAKVARLIEGAIAAEREECAKIAEENGQPEIARLIRERGGAGKAPIFRE